MKRKRYFIVVIASLVLIFLGMMIPVVFAGYSYKNNTVATSYSGGEKIRGNVNISFTNENFDSVFTSNFPGNISLLDLLNKSGLKINEDFNCSTNSCGKTYKLSGGSITQATISNKTLFGFEVVGNRIEEVLINFRITSDVSNVCTTPLKIDLTNRQDYIMQSNSYINLPCSDVNWGCFKSEDVVGNEDSNVGEEICERMSLGDSAAYRVGAVVKRINSGGNLIMKAYFDEKPIGECNLNSSTVSIGEYGTLNCIIENPSPKLGDLYVCLRDNSGSDHFKIRSENKNTCGSLGIGSPFGKDYELFAQALTYDRANISFNENSFDGIIGGDVTSLSEYVLKYIEENYDTERNCSLGCVIPIMIDPNGLTQNITFDNISISYYDEIYGSTNRYGIFKIDQESSKISSKPVILDISKAEFTIPLTSSLKKFELFLSGKKVFEKTINITPGFDFDVNPKFVQFGKETQFQVSISNVTTKWDFGDGSALDSTTNRASHKYEEEGEFEISVEVIKTNGQKSKKTFTVIVGDAKSAISTIIPEYNSRLNNLSLSLNNYTVFIKTNLLSRINVSELNSSLRELNAEYQQSLSNSSLESDYYVELYNKISDLNVPIKVQSTQKGSAGLTIGFDNINTEYIKEISDGGADNLKQQIGGWMFENYNSDVDFEIVSRIGDSGIEPILSWFKIKLREKKQQTDTSFLIVGYPLGAIEFNSEYGQKEVSEGAGTYIELEGDKDIEFIIPEEISVSDLGAYISPLTSKLVGIEDIDPVEKVNPWKASMWPLIILLLIVLVVYLILQEWYKRHYESHLFPKKDDLYNIIAFIHNARLSDLEDSEIRKKLSAARWSGEQITYAFKKIDGKRTGMYEIPLFKWIERKEVKREIDKRVQQGGRKVY